MRKLRAGDGCGCCELRRWQRVGSVVGLGSHPVVEIREETVQELAGGIAHGEQLDGGGDLLFERVARLQEVQKIARNERAERVRDDDDLVVAAAVGGILERVDVAECGHVTLKNAGAGRRFAGRVSEIGVDVENDAQNHASAAGKASEDDGGCEDLGIDDLNGPLLECGQQVNQP